MMFKILMLTRVSLVVKNKKKKPKSIKCSGKAFEQFLCTCTISDCMYMCTY